MSNSCYNLEEYYQLLSEDDYYGLLNQQSNDNFYEEDAFCDWTKLCYWTKKEAFVRDVLNDRHPYLKRSELK